MLIEIMNDKQLIHVVPI